MPRALPQHGPTRQLVVQQRARLRHSKDIMTTTGTSSDRSPRKANKKQKDPLLARLVSYFERSGYVRMPQRDRLKEGYRSYKKGWEVRFVVNDERELAELRLLIEGLELVPGNPYNKGARIVQPVYGKQAVELFAKS
jgi:hypothetical protein